MLTIGSLERIQKKWFIILILKFFKLNSSKMINKSISVGSCLKTKNNELSFVKDKIPFKENLQEDPDLQESKQDFHQNFRIKSKKMIGANKLKKKWPKVWHYKSDFHPQIVTCAKSNNLKKKSITSNMNNMNIFTERKSLKIRDTFTVFRRL